MKSTGPMGSSSIGFSTGSVVVAGDVGDDRHLLPQHRIQDGRFSDVPPSEDADVKPEGFQRCLHTLVFRSV